MVWAAQINCDVISTVLIFQDSQETKTASKHNNLNIKLSSHHHLAFISTQSSLTNNHHHGDSAETWVHRYSHPKITTYSNLILILTTQSAPTLGILTLPPHKARNLPPRHLPNNSYPRLHILLPLYLHSKHLLRHPPILLPSLNSTLLLRQEEEHLQYLLCQEGLALGYRLRVLVHRHPSEFGTYFTAHDKEGTG